MVLSRLGPNTYHLTNGSNNDLIERERCVFLFEVDQKGIEDFGQGLKCGIGLASLVHDDA